MRADAPIPPSAPDGYEEKYMGGAQSLARGRKGMPWWYHLLFFAIAVGPAVALLASSKPGAFVGPLISVPVLTLVWMLFAFLRMTVTPEFVHVQYGLFGPKIAIDRIVSASAESYSAMKYGGWGIKRASDGSWAYSIPGGTGRGVRIEYRDGAATKTAFVSCDDPESIVAAIERARGMRSIAGVRVGGMNPADRSEGAELAAPPAARDAQITRP